MTKTPKHKKTSDSFSVFVTTVAAEVGKTRPLAREEIRYIRKSNWIRILALFDYVCYLAFLFSLVLGLSVMIGFFASAYISVPVVSGLVGFGIPILFSLGFIALTWKRYPKGTKIWLSFAIPYQNN